MLGLIFLVLFLIVLVSGIAFWWYYRKYSILLNEEPIVLTSGSLRHLGIIMDGNRRWAKKRGMKPWMGHKKGVEPVKEALEFCLEQRIPYLTLYVFSLENFKRPPEELEYLFNTLAQEVAKKELDDLFKKGVRVKFIGDRMRFPQSLIPIIQDIEQRTQEGSVLTLNLLFCYGGRQELIAAVRAIADKIQQSELDPQNITERTIMQHLWMGDIPDPDLIIRTAGDQRLSNFLTFQSAYSELCFIPQYWPELTKKDLATIVEQFQKRKRNFGA